MNKFDAYEPVNGVIREPGLIHDLHALGYRVVFGFTLYYAMTPQGKFIEHRGVRDKNEAWYAAYEHKLGLRGADE